MLGVDLDARSCASRSTTRSIGPRSR